MGKRPDGALEKATRDRYSTTTTQQLLNVQIIAKLFQTSLKAMLRARRCFPRIFLTTLSQFVSLSHKETQLVIRIANRENPRNMYTKNAGKCSAAVHWYEGLGHEFVLSVFFLCLGK